MVSLQRKTKGRKHMREQNKKDINKEALKFYREKQGLTQEELASSVPVDKGTYNRWETGKSPVRATNQTKLAEALGLPLNKLRQPIYASEFGQSHLDQRVKWALKNDAALDMVAKTYHVSSEDIINFAPFLFHIVAGASLGERKNKVDEAASALSKAYEVAKNALPHMPYVSSMSVDSLEEDFFEEIEAIDNQQLFDVGGPCVADFTKKNPFVNYLQKLLEKVPEQIRNDFEVEWLNDGLPISRLPDTYLSQLTALPIENELFDKVKLLINSGKLSPRKIRKLKVFSDNSYLDNPEVMSAYLDVLGQEIAKIELNEPHQQVIAKGEVL